MEKNMLFGILVLSLLCTSQLISGQLGYAYFVHIFNQLPVGSNPLTVRCQSKNDDIGYKTLDVNEEFQWHFFDNLFTLFFCHFWWDNKQAVFDVFNRSFGPFKCYNHIPGQGEQTCTWHVRADGFYMATGYEFIKYNTWQI
ncbi:hypothetical protein M9H77_19930 [Catharanthus roseus]|uniref:Uncharacterized protein n=1 Tax=Catharanthus roseus TaxID=4058 RepID=A0ACC0AJJ6_CATRO|nr:hypothetical protein M9H77_19930 [Catharanthus roseus]